MDELLGTMMGRYRLDTLIGEGGMAAVYKAMDTTLERWVALKVITSRRQASEQFLKRFEREAKALAKLSHPSIVDIHDYGEQDGHPYIVMEYLSNGTLKDYMGRPTHYQKAAELLVPVAEALAFAHKKGIVHRDVKPANILFSEHNKPMIGDFGIVKVEDNDGMEALTQVGTGIGTPAYMSPEQGRGTTVDHRTDIYALGVVFYELITGRRPYEAPTPTSFFFKQMTEPLPDPRQFVPSIPAKVVDFVRKVLAVDVNQRLQSMDEFAKMMKEFVAGVPVKPVFQEASTQLASSEGSTMLASQPTPALRVPPPSQQFTNPPIPTVKPTVYDSSNSLPPMPTSLPYQPKKKKKWWIIFVVLGGLVALVLLCFGGLALLGFLMEETEPTPRAEEARDEIQEEEPEDETSQELGTSPTATKKPTVAPTSAPTATPAGNNLGEMTACIQAAGYDGMFDTSQGIEPLFCDNFDDNRNDWYLEPIDTDYISGQTSIVDGILRVQMTSKQNYAQYWQWMTDINTGEDLQIQDAIVLLKIRRVIGPPETLIGMDYRETTDSRFYSFSLYENLQEMTFELFSDGGYTELSSVPTTNWVATDWHMLTLMVYGSGHYLIAADLYGIPFGEIEFEDSTLLGSGEISFWIGAVNAGETIVYEIDDVLVVDMSGFE